jgi:hypothetical protein
MNKEIITEKLKELYKKDPKRAIKVDLKIKELIKLHPERITNDNTIVNEIYEDIRMREDIDKSNKKDFNSNYIKQKSKIYRIDRKKAWNNLIYNIKKNKYRLNFKELNIKIEDIEKKITLPLDYDLDQTIKLRNEYLYLKDKKIHFTSLEDSKEKQKKIALTEDYILILGKNIIYRLNLKTKEIESDNPIILGLKPLDSIILKQDNFIFYWGL